MLKIDELSNPEVINCVDVQNKKEQRKIMNLCRNVSNEREHKHHHEKLTKSKIFEEFFVF